MALRPYITELCASIGASMVADPDRITITTTIVDYEVDRPACTLSLADDGVGRPAKPELRPGTGIVEALARQLQAIVEISEADPGTLVAVIHGEGRAQSDLRSVR